MKYPLIRAISASLVLSAGTAAAATTFHVSPHGSHQPPFADWATAATDIQSAIDAAADGDTVLVTNGVYATGGDDSRVVLKPRMTVRSVNGPEHTWIVGQGPIGPDAVRCATLSSDSVLSGFTLTNGHTRATNEVGGGVYGFGIVSNCVIVGNHAGLGGGASRCRLRNCIVNGNTAVIEGGGVFLSLVENCTVTENHAGYGGGTARSEVWNSIVYYNTADPRWANTLTGAVHYTCTIPDPGGTGNITNAPGLTARGGGRLAPGSPCINAGTNLAWSATGVDIDGEPRLADGTVDIGCDEFQPGAMTGQLQVAIRSDFSEATVGYPLRFWPEIAGRTAGLRWDWQDGTSATHASTTTRTFSDPGDYDIVLTAWNLDGSASATTTVHIVAGITNFVSLAGGHTPPFDSWAAAATNVQAAIGAATVPGTIVLLTNGVYRTGSSLAVDGTPCRIAITNAVIVRSVNGAEHTLIEGSGPLGSNAVRCAYIGRFGRVIGITLTNGHTQIERFSITNATGGGAWCEPEAVLEDCILAGNHAYYRGGGTFQGILRNCRIEGNSAEFGGGISYAWASDCTLIGNNAFRWGGGAEYCVLDHCTMVANQASGGGGASHSRIEHSLLEGNTAYGGAGAATSDLRDCVIQANVAQGSGGGIAGGIVKDSLIVGNYARDGGGCGGGTIRDSVITENRAGNAGGGVYGSTVYSSEISRNTAFQGGGAYWSDVWDSVLEENTASYEGGGARIGLLADSTIRRNSAHYGGGTYNATVRNCIVRDNSADTGGGTYLGAIENSLILGNVASGGGGSASSTLRNCTVIYNRADGSGGVRSATLTNCIVYFNSGSLSTPNYGGSSSFENSCTVPDPGGIGNITNLPMFIGTDLPYLAADSPCIDAGTNQAWMAGALDLQGNPRIVGDTVDMGCYEAQFLAPTGTIQVAISDRLPYVIPGYPIDFTAEMQGAVSGFQWSWGDQSDPSPSLLQAAHVYQDHGDYDVVLSAWNLDTTASATLTVHVVAGYTNFVSRSGTHEFPYDSWPTAATNIQAAIEANIPGGTVLVTNGVYDAGGAQSPTDYVDPTINFLVNRVTIAKPMTVRSVNGPDVSIIVGRGPRGIDAIRCAYVGQGATLAGFTLTNGHTSTPPLSHGEWDGGGAWIETGGVVSNCVIVGNEALRGGGVANGYVVNSLIAGNRSYRGGGAADCTIEDSMIVSNTATAYGGGVDSCEVRRSLIQFNVAESNSGGGSIDSTLWHCRVVGNRAGSYGGGVASGTLYNCLVVGNTAAGSGGGMYHGSAWNSTITRNTGSSIGGTSYTRLVNCVVHDNTADSGIANWDQGTILHTCTTPLPPGLGNIADDPQFVDAASSNFHLSATSPCIDAGTNEVWMAGAVDLDGIPRVYHRAVDMGCYEFPLGKPDLDADYLDDDWELGYFPGPGGLTNLSYYADWDGDGFLDGEEFHAGTRPDDAASRLGVTSVVLEPAGDRAVIRWSSVSNKTYAIMGVSNLVDSAAIPLAVAIPATPPENVYTDAVHGIRWRAYGVAVERE